MCLEKKKSKEIAKFTSEHDHESVVRKFKKKFPTLKVQFDLGPRDA